MVTDVIQNKETLAAPITTTQTQCYSSKTACSVNIANDIGKPLYNGLG